MDPDTLILHFYQVGPLYLNRDADSMILNIFRVGNLYPYRDVDSLILHFYCINIALPDMSSATKFSVQYLMVKPAKNHDFFLVWFFMAIILSSLTNVADC